MHAHLVLLSPDARSREEHAGLSPSEVGVWISPGDLRVKSRKVNGLGLGAGPGGGATQTDPVSDHEGNPRILLPECCKHPSSRNVQLQNSEL